jgi:hypothetical protein
MSGVDLDQLLERIQSVDFDYDEERVPRNPMAPLVGPMAPPRLASADSQTEEQRQAAFEAQLAVRAMAVTGIIWDAYNPVAIIDDEVVGMGYEFPTGVSVEKIEPDRVIMRVNDSLVPVELKEL